jgi:hypothetical protein
MTMDKQPSGVTYVKLQMYGANPYDILTNEEFQNDLFLKNLLIRHFNQFYSLIMLLLQLLLGYNDNKLLKANLLVVLPLILLLI